MTSACLEFPFTLTLRALHGKSHCHGYSCRLPALDFIHFDVQSRHGYTFEMHSYSCHLPALVLNRSDIQSRRGHHCECHGYCRFLALVLNFSPLRLSEHCTGNRIAMVSPAVYPRLFSSTMTCRALYGKSHCHSFSLPFVRTCLEFSTTLTFRTPQENHIVSVTFATSLANGSVVVRLVTNPRI